MPAKQMLIDVTQPLEEAARAIPGALNVVSTTSRGAAQIFVDFPWGSNMTQALLRVDTAFAQTLPQLPPGTAYDAIEMSPNMIMPFVSYALVSDDTSAAELRRMAQYQIGPQLTGIGGIRRVGVIGGQTPEIQVSLDPLKLQAYGLSDCPSRRDHRRGQRHQLGGPAGGQRPALPHPAKRCLHLDRIGARRWRCARPTAGSCGSPISATIEMGSVPQWLLVMDNGKPAVTFDVYQQDDADSLQLAKAVQAKLGRLHAHPAERRARLQMVRPDRSGPLLDRRGGGSHSDRPGARRARGARVPAQLARSRRSPWPWCRCRC